ARLPPPPPPLPGLTPRLDSAGCAPLHTGHRTAAQRYNARLWQAGLASTPRDAWGMDGLCPSGSLGHPLSRGSGVCFSPT
uniref:Uncharacterized protein n=1 Tax=Naja naja TaxID=35670 RepID=A0A8C6YDK9_NAJNA